MCTNMTAFLGIIAVVLSISCAAASQIVVGGAQAGWTTGLQYDPINVTFGDSLVSIILSSFQKHTGKPLCIFRAY